MCSKSSEKAWQMAMILRCCLVGSHSLNLFWSKLVKLVNYVINLRNKKKFTTKKLPYINSIAYIYIRYCPFDISSLRFEVTVNSFLNSLVDNYRVQTRKKGGFVKGRCVKNGLLDTLPNFWRLPNFVESQFVKNFWELFSSQYSFSS